MVTDEAKLPAEIARLIKEQAVVSLGPWPRDLELFIFVSTVGWCCGLSPATQASEVEYREGMLKIAREMQGKFPAGSVKDMDRSSRRTARHRDIFLFTYTRGARIRRGFFLPRP